MGGAPMRLIKRKVFAALFLFGIAFLDKDYSPFENLVDFLNSALVLAVIFFGDVLWSWITRR
jgi:hypothetical protein